MRSEFAKFTKNLLNQNSNFSLILGDISVGLFLDKDENIPKNTFNMGVLEQSMISFASGMSRGGITPIVHTISPFMIERAYEQIKLDMSYNQCKVILVSANGPYDYNKLGPTHHCSSDIPLLSHLSNITSYLPATIQDVSKCLEKAINNDYSSYIRLTNKSYDKESLLSNKVYSNNKNKNDISIFVGESLCLNANIIDQVDNWMYTFDIESLNEGMLRNFKNISFWEPYSYPILGNKFKNILGNKYNIRSYTYPNSIEKGIFYEPQFIESTF